MNWSLAHVSILVLGTSITAHPDNARHDCVFPFTFLGVEYNECAPGISQLRPWCATSLQSERKNVEDYKYCSAADSDCVFPFTFEGVEYNECAPGISQLRPWCATSLQSERKNIEDYKYCSAADSDNVTPVTPGTRTNLLPTNCVAFSDYVVGGREVPVKSFMWMALIGYDGYQNNIFWGCGGSLISQRYVITAAHCADIKIVLVRLGEHDISNITPDCEKHNSQVCAPLPQDINISPENIVVHREWDKITQKYDIALIRLDQPAELHSYVQPICLPPSNGDVRSFLNAEREAEVAGWGATNDSPGSNVRLMVKVPFVPLEKCRLLLNSSNLHQDKGQVCFGGVQGKDSCNGDSGGPLVGYDYRRNATSLNILLGVVSYGPTACGTENQPAVYTDVAHYRNWIEGQLRP